MAKVISSEQEIGVFLRQLKAILASGHYDLDILPKKKGEEGSDPYTTANTMIALDYDRTDVARELANLEVDDYLETMTDDKDSMLPPFYVFVKSIMNRDVYIKVKIRDAQMGRVFCVSFHFTRFPLPSKMPFR